MPSRHNTPRTRPLHISQLLHLSSGCLFCPSRFVIFSISSSNFLRPLVFLPLPLPTLSTNLLALLLRHLQEHSIATLFAGDSYALYNRELSRRHNLFSLTVKVAISLERHWYVRTFPPKALQFTYSRIHLLRRSRVKSCAEIERELHSSPLLSQASCTLQLHLLQIPSVLNRSISTDFTNPHRSSFFHISRLSTRFFIC